MEDLREQELILPSHKIREAPNIQMESRGEKKKKKVKI